ncbi:MULTISPECIES: oxidoreductase [unclassified Crossiella]|uniref:oxidoreductase n=1 Tax=Crossiella sp. CA-258035 TaxID=2981138 RepID=UPI0024BD18D5|nr:oxidoreductase [Crossiella sp. CA-258035]WHT21206.1 oxidoreductase [Crossiella sp. CA-258035]
MGLFDRFRRKERPGQLRSASNADTAHLEAWAAARHGVEAYLEPKTTVTETTVVFIAHDGEWTRRRISGFDAAQKLARKLKIPMYEANKVGYPQRMRDYTARQRAQQRRDGKASG